MSPKKVLTVAGSDCSGGAGIQADLKTFQERDVYGMVSVTCLVAMIPENWHHVVTPVDPDMIEKQFKAVADGIGVDAVKTGMLPTVEIIKLTGELLATAKIPKVVIDPVMVCKGAGQPLFPENTKAMIDYLLPLADVVTPNTFEAEQLAGMEEFKSEDDLLEAARKIHGQGAKNVVIKAARIFDNKTVDLLYDGTNATWLRGEKVGTSWTHGAGCSFSACITAELAKGKSVTDAVAMAREFVRCGLEHSFPLNQFVGPIYHKALSKYNPVVAGK